MNRVAEDIICHGRVTKKYEENGQHYAKLEISAGNPRRKDGYRRRSGDTAVAASV